MRRSVKSGFAETYVRRAQLWTGACLLVIFGGGCTGTVSPSSRMVSQPPGAASFAISGTVTPTAGGSGATVTLSGAASATTTASNAGAYSFNGLAAGTYAVTPGNTGYTFNPHTQAATITNGNVTGLNFAATAQTGPTSSISGTIAPTAGGSGATVLLSGPTAATTTTNASGNYTFGGLPNGAYTVTPNESGFAFTPGSQSVTLSGVNQTGVNFTAAANASGQAHSVALTCTASTSTVTGYNLYRSTVNGSGYTKLNSSLVASLSYSDTNVQPGTTYFYVATAVDSGGDESANSNQVSAAIP